MTSDNPAQRLFEICTVSLKGAPHVTTRQVWGETLDINSENLSEIYRSLGILNELANETRERIEKIPNITHELFLEDLPLVQKAISPTNLDTNWSQYSQHLTTGAMKGLKFCANELAKHHFEDSIASQTLDDLLAEANELTGSVMGADIDAQLKNLLVDLLEMLRKSILEYRLRGACGIKKALVYFVGATITNYELIEKEKDKRILEKVSDFVTKINIVLTTAIHFKALCGMAAPLLQLLPPLHK